MICADRLEVVIVQHQLRRGKVGLALHGELIAPMGDLGSLDPLHDGTVKEETLVARMMASGGCNRSYEALAARRGRLVRCAIPASMTWGVLGHGCRSWST
jgi:hypothetical protein